jgi:hypothetical protein
VDKRARAKPPADAGLQEQVVLGHCTLRAALRPARKANDRVPHVLVAWILMRASGLRIVKMSPIIGARVSNIAPD